MADVKDMFGPSAAKYATSTVHNNPGELARLVALVEPTGSERLLDVATGTGNTALAFAPHVKEAVALDLTPQMLEQVDIQAKAAGLTNVVPKLGDALAIPFEDDSFDIVTVRLAPHHFPSLPAFVAEVARVLKVGGKFLAVDTTSPADPDTDQEINEIEILRDPSHVRNYSPAEWKKAVIAAGFAVTHEDDNDDWNSTEDSQGGMDLDAWIERINTPQDNRTELRRRFAEAAPALQAALKIRYEGHKVKFSLPRLTLVAVLG